MSAPAAAPPEGMLTLAEAAARMGRSPNTLRTYVQNGRLPRADGRGRGVPLRFRAEDCDRLAAEIAAWKAEHRGEGVWRNGQRRCAKCREWKDIDTAFSKSARLSRGIASWCKTCTSANHADYYRRNWAERRAYAEAYKRAHPEKFRRYRKTQYRRYRTQQLAQHLAWREANRQKYLRICRESSARARAIALGKESLMCRRKGFSLVRNASGDKWRAVRLDVPIGREERAVAHYTFYSELRQWVVTAPPLARSEDAPLLRRLMTRETRKQRKAKSAS